MDLVNATDLQNWANRLESQNRLPQLVRRLICATGVGLTRITMPAGEGIGKPGWDGIVEASEADAHVPQGSSVWEMGVDKDPIRKANKDYKSRTSNPRGVVQAETTFVFVTPRRWRTLEAWVSRKREEGLWKNVIAYDADDIETWLERAPAVHVWLATLLGKEPSERQSLEGWWDSWCSATQPALATSALLFDREIQMEEVRDHLNTHSSVLVVSSDSQEESIAFIASLLLEGDDSTRALLQRAIVVHSEKVWIQLAVSASQLLLIPVFENPNFELALRHDHRIIAPVGRDIAGNQGVELPRIRREGLVKVLEDSHLASNRVQELATLGRRSLISLRRALSKHPELQSPLWSRPERVREVLPALLAGRWRDRTEGDREAIEQLACRPYDEVIRDLTAWTFKADPPVRRIGEHWGLTSKRDAWLLLARYLTSDDLDRFREIALSVLGSEDPVLDLSADERFAASILGVSRKYSNALIEGIADSLAAMATLSDQIPLPNNRVGASEASWVVRRIFDKAAEDPSGQTWMAIAEQLPLLAEAAPEALLTSVEKSLSGKTSNLKELFQDSTESSFLSSSSPHPSLQWALEALAWEPRYLLRAVLALAGLARLDPGGRLANRPFDSLVDIFRVQSPATTASLPQRLRSLDAMYAQDPETAWQLTLRLAAPRPSVVMVSHLKWRDWKPDERPILTYGEALESLESLVERLLANVGSNSRRWVRLLGSLASFPKAIRERIVEQFQQTTGFDDSERVELADMLRKIAKRHRRIADESWALPTGEIDQLEEIRHQVEPTAVETKHAWLFRQEAYWDFDSDDRKVQQDNLEESRLKALASIYKDLTLTDLLSWASTIGEGAARSVGSTLANLDLREDEIELILTQLGSKDSFGQRLSRQFVFTCARNQGDEWFDWAEATVRAHTAWAAEHRAEFLSSLRADTRVFDLAESVDDEVMSLYWQKFDPNWVSMDGRTTIRAAEKMIEFDRSYEVVCMLRMNRDDLLQSKKFAEVAATALEKAAQSPPPEKQNDHFSYIVRRLLDYLDEVGFDEARLAGLEWLYLPLFQYEPRSSSLLHRYLAKEPQFFIDIVSMVFRREDEAPRDLSPDEHQYSTRATGLLLSWKILPGFREDDTIDEEEFQSWVYEARRLLANCGRLDIGDQQIGRLLSHGPRPQTGGVWPDIPIRNLIEELASEDLDLGFQLGLYESRGVTSRGLTDGGEQERELVEYYQELADDLFDSWPRTAGVMSQLAETYLREAQGHDLKAELREDDWR